MKVYRSVGAIAVYSPPRAAGLAAAAVIAVGGVGFLGGLAVGDAGSSSSASLAPATPPTAARSHSTTGTATTLAPATAPRAATPPPAATHRRAAAAPARSGRATHKSSSSGSSGPSPAAGVSAGAPDLHVGDAYMVRLQAGAGGAPFAIGPHIAVVPGRSYFLCAGGERLCTTEGSGSR